MKGENKEALEKLRAQERRRKVKGADSAKVNPQNEGENKM